MMWREIAQDNFEAVSRLRLNRHWKSCESRAYYAGYSIVTGALIGKGLAPRIDYGTWSHSHLPQITANHLLGGAASVNLARTIECLYRLRLFADYRPDVIFEQKEAFESAGLMYQIFRQLKKEYK